MKRLLSFCMLTVLISCSTSEKSGKTISIPAKGKDLPQKWKLTAMTGMIANVPPISGNDMEYQEVLLLHSDSTFTKTRERDGNIMESSGGFEIVAETDGDYLVLSYPEKNELVGNCSNEPKEWFRFDSETQLVGTWWACDGPGLFFERQD
ncbi:hypothetical protein [Maribacter sp. 2-571]|uniref:hypothetical protein n=1 Tax=Maribacter sp. 2-571 TaxID=3417569 RepID=UPI003D34527C